MSKPQRCGETHLDENNLKPNLFEKILEGFRKQGYAVDIIHDANINSKLRGVVIKARKRRGVTIYLSPLPDLRGQSRLSVIKLGGGSVIERFMHTKLPPRSAEDIVCPHFLELKWAYGCPFNCSYCYLQGTLRLLPTQKKPMIKEREKVRRHLLDFLEAPLKEPEILNSGELCDSLMYEKTEFSITKNIAPLFEEKSLNRTGHKILIVTKSDRIEELLKLSENKHVVVSFSINTPQASKRWEKGAADPLSRISAARLLYEAGFEVRVRIDPIIPYPHASWIKEYCNLVDKIFGQLWPSRITLGSLRGLSTTIRKTWDKSWLIYLEEQSRWGLRPNHKIRYEAYRMLIDYMDNEYGFSRVALCKEPVRMWRNLGLDWKMCRCNCTW